MTDDNLQEQIKEMLVTNLMLKIPKEQIGNDTPLFGNQGIGLDSIDALEIAVGLEKTFGVKLADSGVARKALASVNSIRDFILEQRSKQG